MSRVTTNIIIFHIVVAIVIVTSVVSCHISSLESSDRRGRRWVAACSHIGTDGSRLGRILERMGRGWVASLSGRVAEQTCPG